LRSSSEAAAAVAPGEVVGRGIGRSFKITLTPTRSLKETILRRELPQTRELWALRDVDVHVRPGEAFGIVGRNGSGKSTLLKLIAGIFAPTTGTLAVGGRVGSLIEIGAGFHPEFTGRENVYLNAAIYGLKRSYIDEHIDEILSFAELESFADVPVRTYSSGMYMRLGFSVAMHINPNVLLLDEVLAVGDESFQHKCYAQITDFKRSGGTIVFVSHDPNAVERVCDRAILLDEGRVVEEGVAGDVVRAYHRRLVTGAETAGRVNVGTRSSERCRVHEVRAVAADRTVRDRFTEGEPAALEVWLYAEESLEGLRVTVGIRDGAGRPVGSQMLTDVRLRPQRLERVLLRFPGLPMREGRYFVDVGVGSDSLGELALAERALELTVFGQDTGASGPIRLGGTWELPPWDGAGEG
jgi:ABC-type polysaccharide/polyol phosphate transport system ATPase subunit